VRTIIEVGSYDGNDTLHYAQMEDVFVYSFEPIPQHVEKVKEKTKNFSNIEVIQKAVGAKNELVLMNVNGQGAASSLYDYAEDAWNKRPWNPGFTFTDKIEVELIRLDSFCEEREIQQIDFLHCDAQGNDLNVLLGLGKYIQVLQAGMVEASYNHQLYEGTDNSYGSIVDFLNTNGFELVNVDNNEPYGTEVNIHFKRK